MRFLFVGDIMGRPGREAVAHHVPRLKGEKQIDCVIANGENAAHGKGLTPQTAQELFVSGVDVITMGNHTWDKPEINDILTDERILRPANYPPSLPGKGHAVYHRGSLTFAVVQLMGRHNIANIDCPFRKADEILKTIDTPIIFVDMHAEASSEKQAMGWHLNGRVSAVVGSHTHVQTADERILPGGTAYLGDAGMTGPVNSVIGGSLEPAIKRFLTGLYVRIDVAEGDAQLNGCLVDVDDKTGKAVKIERVKLDYPRAAAEAKKRSTADARN
jgi:metallophosphoesterase (TIGR00282 family)